MSYLTIGNPVNAFHPVRAPQRARILLVEDKLGDAELVRAVLHEHSVTPVEVVHCTRVADAVSRLDGEEFQLVMLDLNLPDSQGLETLNRVQLAAKMIPIVVLTGQEELELSINAIRLGAQECLCKNHLSGAMLVRTINNAVERHQILAATTIRALTDELTGLYNRRGLLTVSPTLFKTARQLGMPLVLLYADLDDLKSINDTLGHEAGSRAIQDGAAILRESFSGSDVLSRLGGDEFAVLALGDFGENGELLRERVETAASNRNAEPGRDYRLSFSLGILDLDATRSAPLVALLHEADRRMYAHKRSKRRRNVTARCLGTEQE